MFLFNKKKKKQERGRRRRAWADRAVRVRVEVPGHARREFVLQASLLAHRRLAPLMAEAEAEYGVQQLCDVVRVPCTPYHFLEAMVWATVEEAMQGGKAHGVAVEPPVVGNRRDLGWYLAQRQPRED